jgi:hypothetical protein
MNPDTCFTISIRPTGYSDQLNQFMLLYELGLRLGLRYIYTDIAGTYGRFNENTRKFIDIVFQDSDGEIDREQFTEHQIEVNSAEISQQGITSGDGIIDYLKAKIGDEQEKKSLFVLTLKGDRNPLLALLSGYKDDITAPLRRAMNRQIRTCTHHDLYPFDGDIKVFIHLRLGDVTRLATPWPHDFNLWHSTDLGALKVSTPESLRLLRVCVRELTEVYGEDKICFSIHSDNLDLAQRDYSTLMKNTSIVSEEQQSISRHLLTEMSAELGLFKQFQNAKVFIDKDPAGVEKLISALINCDLAITNGLQRMIAKLIGVFYTNRPIALACLMENSADKDFHSLLLPTDSIQFIPLEYQRFSLRPLKRFIDQQITKTQELWRFPDTLVNSHRLSEYCPFDLYQAGCELQTANHLEDALACFELSDEMSNSNDDAIIKQIEILEQLGRTHHASMLQKKLSKKTRDTLIAEQNYVSTKFNMGEKAALKKLIEVFGENLLATKKNQKIASFISAGEG